MASEIVEPWLHDIPALSVKPASIFLGFLVLGFLLYSSRSPKIPVLNGRRGFELTDSRIKKEFVVGARDMLRRWFTANPDRPVSLISDIGPMTFLPPYMTDEIRNDGRLSFSKWAFQVESNPPFSWTDKLEHHIR